MIHDPRFYRLNSDGKGKFLLEKGDDHFRKGNVGKAINYYNEAKKYCDDEAQKRLDRANGKIPVPNIAPPTQNLEASIGNMSLNSQGYRPSPPVPQDIYSSGASLPLMSQGYYPPNESSPVHHGLHPLGASSQSLLQGNNPLISPPSSLSHGTYPPVAPPPSMPQRNYPPVTPLPSLSQGIYLPSASPPPVPYPSASSDGVYQVANPVSPSTKTLRDVNVALSEYYRSRLTVQRVSGRHLTLESCHVNLAILESHRQRQQDQIDMIFPNQSTPKHFIRLPSYEQDPHINTDKSIQLSELFDKRHLTDGTKGIPKRVIITGRAGIGKSTACKKLVHLFQNGLSNARYGAILWLPLRYLQGCRHRNLKDMLLEIYFTKGDRSEREGLANQLIKSAESGQVLFVLDGLDEILTESLSNESLRNFLKILLNQPQAIITSRPFGADQELIQKVDLALEVVGFSTEDIKQYVKSNIGVADDSKKALNFIQQSPLIQGLTNTPVQLDMICQNWNEIALTEDATTISQLYQVIIRKLWRDDAIRRKKIDVSNMSSKDIDSNMSDLVDFLGYLAFRNLKHGHDISFGQNTMHRVAQEINQHRRQTGELELLPTLLDEVKDSSLLLQIENISDFARGSTRKTWNFIHLTFQEYFAAKWLSKYFQTRQSNSSTSSNLMDKESSIEFVRNNKYNPRFEIVWWFLAGQLEGKELESYFNFLQKSPRDLIGPRHQLLLAGCYSESRSKLSVEFATLIENDMIRWLRLEAGITMKPNDGSYLVRHIVFPEHVVFRGMAGCEDTQKFVILSLRHRKYLSPASIDELIQMIIGENTVNKQRAIEALGGQLETSDKLIAILIHVILNDEDFEAKEAAAKALGNHPNLPGSTINTLISALYHGEQVIKYASMMVLRNQANLSESIILALAKEMLSEDLEIGRKLAFEIVREHSSKLSESTITFLANSLEHGKSDIKDKVIQVLSDRSNLPEYAIIVLIEVLGDEDYNVRYSASTTLGKQLKFSDLVTTTLIDGLNHPNSVIRCGVARALAGQAESSESVTNALAMALDDEDWSVRTAAARSLGENPELPKSITSLLVRAFYDKDYIEAEVQSRVSRVLQGQVIVNQILAVSFANTIQDEYSDVIIPAIDALGNQDSLPESTIEALATALQDTNHYIQESAVFALAKHSTLSENIANTLVSLLQDKNSTIRIGVTKAISSQFELFGSTVTALTELLKQDEVADDKDIRITAAEILGNYPNLPEYTTDALVQLLKDEFLEVEAAATRALCNQMATRESWVVEIAQAMRFEKSLGEHMNEMLHYSGLYRWIGSFEPAHVALLYNLAILNYSFRYSVSMYIDEGQLQFFTPKGFGQSAELSPEVTDLVKTIFLLTHKAAAIDTQSFYEE